MRAVQHSEVKLESHSVSLAIKPCVTVRCAALPWLRSESSVHKQQFSNLVFTVWVKLPPP